jgi:hypothetical protein
LANHVLHRIPSADVQEHASLCDLKAVDPASRGTLILGQLPFEQKPGVAVWAVFSRTGDPWALILLAAVGVALAMLGSGAWSIDALLFGRRPMIL